MKKGPLFEAQVVGFLQEHGFPFAERRVMGGSRDRGDVAGIPGVCLEIKNQAKQTLAEWLDEAIAEAAHSGRGVERLELPIVIHKRRGRGSAGDSYATMDVWTLVELLKGWAK